MFTHAQKTPLDYSNARITVCPEIPSPKTSHLVEDLREKEKKRGKNPEHRPDPKSAWAFDKIDQNSEWKSLSALIQSRLKSRGISTDADSISDYLRTYANQIQDEIDAETEAERAAEAAEFNLHISKLQPRDAAILVLRIREHWTFTPIGKLLNISDQQADNLFQDAEKRFNSETIQACFIGHEITLDTEIGGLIAALVSAAQPKSPAGRKPKGQIKKPQQTADLFQGVF